MRGLHIQRPIVVTEKQNLYGDVFNVTQGHQHAYECVQPLQGVITFGEPEDDENPDFARNNISFQSKRPTSKLPEWKTWDYAIYGMLAVKVGLGSYMLSELEKQTAYNDIYLTNFDPASNYLTYSIEAAGVTNPLNCLIIALFLVIFSVIIGLTSSTKYMLKQPMSITLCLFLVILQVLAFALHFQMLVAQKQQVTINCLTTTSMISLHVVTFLLSLVGLVKLAMEPQSDVSNTHADRNSMLADGDFVIEHSEDIKDALKIKYVTTESIHGETTGNFWLCVVEDLNTILCYAFVVRACDAQSSIHDDSTTFFDVLCIVFLGFLQHVANILMIFHAHIEKQTEVHIRNMPGTGDTFKEKKQAIHDQSKELMTFIARTRLLLFFMIGVTVVFFYLRISPTYEDNPIAIPYEILRVLALITMVSLNTLHSAWYEFQNASNRKNMWDTSPTWKLGALSFIALVFSVMLLVNTQFDKDEKTRHLLHVLPTPTPSPISIS